MPKPTYEELIEFLEYLYNKLEIKTVEDDCGPLRFHSSTLKLREEIRNILEENYEANSA